MLKKRILMCLLVILLALVMIPTNVFAINNEKEILSDIPYDYMNNIKIKSIDAYENLTTPEKKLIYTIPDEIAKTLSTKALLETILNNRYIVDLFAYENFEYALKLKEHQFKILEFLDRTDANKVLDFYIDKYNKSFSQKEIAYDLYLKNMTSGKDISNAPYDYTHLILQIELMNRMKNIIQEETNNISLIQRAYNDIYIVTNNNKPVLVRENQTWLQLFIPEIIAQAAENDFLEEYPNNIEVKGISPIYNCHSYAWYSQNTSINNIWMFNADAFFAEATSATHRNYSYNYGV